jgi:tetratricopeptide (TPR) repeat protein/pimeloyl-ACP methyl ester carboxylesterase
MNQLVISVHGIRTFGGWQERLECLLYEHGAGRTLRVVNYKYGYFSIFAFLVPFLRWVVVRRFRRYLIGLMRDEHWDRIDLVGHSFGTHILAWALYGLPETLQLKVNTLILGGSVLKGNFPWQTLLGRRVQRLVNDCGIRDQVLLLNQLVVLFTGMAGRLGFNGGTGRTFRNRYFDFGHGGYFMHAGAPDDAFMIRYWLPLLLSEADPELVDVRKATALNGVYVTLANNAEPIKLMIYLAPIVAFSVWISSLYLEADRQRGEAERQRNEAQANFRSASNLLTGFVQVVSETVQPIAKLDVVASLLDKAERLVGEFSAARAGEPAIIQQHAWIYMSLAQISWDRGDIPRMIHFAEQGRTILTPLVTGKNTEARLLSGHGSRLLGRAHFDANNIAQGREEYENAINDLEALMGENSQRQIPSWWLRSLADLYQELGDALLNQDQPRTAREAFLKSHATRVRMRAVGGPKMANVEHDIAWSENKFGDVEYWTENDPEALRWFTTARDHLQKLGDELWSNLTWPVHLALMENNIGLIQVNEHRFQDAVDTFGRAETLMRRTLDHDQRHVGRRSALAWTLDNRAEALLRWAISSGDQERFRQAGGALHEALTLRTEVAAEMPRDILAQLGVLHVRANIVWHDAIIKASSGDREAAARAYADAGGLILKLYGRRLYSRAEVLLRAIQHFQAAGLAYADAGREAECADQFRQIADLAALHHARLGNLKLANHLHADGQTCRSREH